MNTSSSADDAHARALAAYIATLKSTAAAPLLGWFFADGSINYDRTARTWSTWNVAAFPDEEERATKKAHLLAVAEAAFAENGLMTFHTLEASKISEGETNIGISLRTTKPKSPLRWRDVGPVWREMFYDSITKMKRIPDHILNGDRGLIQAFVMGVFFGDGCKERLAVDTYVKQVTGQVGAAGLFALYSVLGRFVSINAIEDDKNWNAFSIRASKRHSCLHRRVLKKLRVIPEIGTSEKCGTKRRPNASQFALGFGNSKRVLFRAIGDLVVANGRRQFSELDVEF